MNSANRGYLQRCLKRHGELQKIHYGHEQPLKEMEDALEHVRRNCRISYADVERIRDSEIWGADFGYWPSHAELAPVLEEMPLGFLDKPKNEKTIIRKLFEKFRQIEPVSGHPPLRGTRALRHHQPSGGEGAGAGPVRLSR